VNFPNLEVRHATFNRLSMTIRLETTMPSQFDRKLIGPFLPTLKRPIRHELEHYRQSQRTGDPYSHAMQVHHFPAGALDGHYKHNGWRNFLEAKQYFLNSTEVEAHVVGMATEARACKVGFEVVFEKRLEELKNLLTSEYGCVKGWYLGSKVKKVWKSYAKVRFPNLNK
jgi:hypothetical protein